MWSRSDGVRPRVAQCVLVLALWAVAAHAQQTASAGHPADCSLYTGLSYVHDSKIDHTEPEEDTFGGQGGHCRFGSSSDGTLEVDYDGPAVVRRAHRDHDSQPLVVSGPAYAARQQG